MIIEIEKFFERKAIIAYDWLVDKRNKILISRSVNKINIDTTDDFNNGYYVSITIKKII